MQEYLNNVIRSGNNGLYFFQLPTGYGKTYGIMQAVAQWLVETDGDRKIIFLTYLTKNLPDDTLKLILSDEPRLFEDNVLRLRSNLEEVIEKLPEMDIPEEFRTERYDALLTAIRALKQADAYSIKDTSYLAELRSRAEKAERSFRKELTAKLKTVSMDKNERLAAVRSQARYHWIGELYPAVYTSERRVLFMTVKKFMSKNSPIIEPVYDFLNAAFIRNSIIVIDEFDASKQVITDHVLEIALSAQSEYLSLFRQLLAGLDTSRFSTLIGESCGQRIRHFIDIGREIAERYHLANSYKTEESSVDGRQNFLFCDGNFHTILHEGRQYIRTYYNERENRVSIRFITKDAYYQEHRENDIQLYSMLRYVQRYLNRFRSYLNKCAERLCTIINSRRTGTEDEMTQRVHICALAAAA